MHYTKFNNKNVYFYLNDVPYLNQKHKSGCLYTCISMISTYYNINTLNEHTFINFENGYSFNVDNSFKHSSFIVKKQEITEPYLINNVLKFGDDYFLFDEFKKIYTGFNRFFCNSNNPKYVYLNFVKNKKAPVIISIKGVKNKQKPHYVLVVGVTLDDKFIIHDTSSKKVAFDDILLDDELFNWNPINGYNTDIIWYENS